MAEGFSAATANGIWSAILQQRSFVYGAIWAQLHVGAPGAAGTANIAAETTRVNVSGCFGTDPVAGEGANDAALGPWLSVAATETYTHITLWTLSAGGTFIISGEITAAGVTLGDDFPVPIGDCTLILPIAA